MRETREDRKHRLSLKGSHAVQVRWDKDKKYPVGKD